MQSTNPNAHTYVNGTDVETHGLNCWNSLIELLPKPVHRRLRNMEGDGVQSVQCRVQSVNCKARSVQRGVWSVECKVSSVKRGV